MDEIIEYYEMEVSNENGSWYEKIESFRTRDGEIPAPKTDVEAFYMAKLIIDYFNSSLKDYETERELEGVRKVEIIKSYRDL